MIFNSGGVLGRGTTKAVKKSNLKPKFEHSLNYIGNTCGNRLVHLIMPKIFYETNETVLDECFERWASGGKRLLKMGMRDRRGKLWRLAFQAALGDWPGLVKAGHLTRSFNTVPKQYSVRSILRGVCHCCFAGKDDYPFEDSSLSASHTLTMYRDEPFSREPEILAMVRYVKNRPRGFKFDGWHGFHLGTGMIWDASGLVEALPLYGGTSVDANLDLMNDDLQWYCLQTGQRLHCKNLTRNRLGWKKEADFPKGSWQKAGDTIVLLKFLIHVLEKNQERIQDNALLLVFLEGSKAIDYAFGEMYGHGVFIYGSAAKAIAEAGLHFLQCHTKASRVAWELRKNRLMQMPKMHLLFHVFSELYFQQRDFGYGLNPLVYCLQMQEDLIGKVARMSRRADPRCVMLRSLHLFLISAAKHRAETQGVM